MRTGASGRVGFVASAGQPRMRRGAITPGSEILRLSSVQTIHPPTLRAIHRLRDAPPAARA